MKLTIQRKYKALDKISILECFKSVCISPLKVHAQPLSERVNLGTRKLNTAISTIQEKIARALNVAPEEINLDTNNAEDVDLLRIKEVNSDRLMQLTKERLSTIRTNKEIIQVLTLAPETSSIKNAVNFFNVIEYTACKALSLVQKKEVLVFPNKKRGKTISRYN